jgi:chromosome partitioning protein
MRDGHATSSARPGGAPFESGDPRASGRAYVIVLGNEKGGSGKSTTSMHLFAALAKQGFRVGAMDLDLRQQSFFRYLDNRQSFAARKNAPLILPQRADIKASAAADRKTAEREDEARFAEALDTLASENDFVIIDTPGSFSHLSRCAHAAADTLVTPLNDSLIDFDMLGRVDPATGKVLGPSVYSEMVWMGRQMRAAQGKPAADWIVMRNRLSMLDARNKRHVAALVERLSKRIGFRVAPGFSERVIYRELFLNGLTLLDLKEPAADVKVTMSHVAARQEVRDLMRSLALPGVDASRV